MKRNNGYGDVISKNQLILEDTLGCGRITAVRHGNGRDWWLLAPEHNNNAFYRILLDPEGIHVLGKLMIGDTNQDPYGYGQAVFSPNGEYYARIKSAGNSDHPIFKIGLFNFDRCQGILSNYIDLSFADTILHQAASGIAFAPNSRYLYTIGQYVIYQFDIENPDIYSTKVIVALYDNFLYYFNPSVFALAQLGPDNKLYVAAGYTPFLHAIENPDSAGLACNVQQHILRLPFNNSSGILTIPNNPNYRLGKWEGSPCDTLNSVPEVEYGNCLQIKALPNPASEAIQFELSVMNNHRPMELEIYNSLSQKIDLLRITPFQGIVPYQVNRLVNGIYIAVLRQNRKAVGRVKFVVNH
jgi:hypothetical protein